ncbi:hypothetical protein FHT22_003176 [Pedobacter sp. SG918]|nr:hypothetical protein [Pedobacter sp. SG918]
MMLLMQTKKLNNTLFNRKDDEVKAQITQP